MSEEKSSVFSNEAQFELSYYVVYNVLIHLLGESAGADNSFSEAT